MPLDFDAGFCMLVVDFAIAFKYQMTEYSNNAHSVFVYLKNFQTSSMSRWSKVLIWSFKMSSVFIFGLMSQ